MSKMSETTAKPSVNELSRKEDALYYCERHGVMNKSSDLKDKADQIAKKA